MKFNLFASLGVFLSLSVAQTVLASDVRPENYDSLVPADVIESEMNADFDLSELDLDELTEVDAIGRPGSGGRPGGGGRPGVGGPGGGRPGAGSPGMGRPGFGGGRPGGGGVVRPAPGFGGRPGFGRPGFGNHPGFGRPGFGYGRPGYFRPGYPGYYPPTNVTVQCYAEDGMGNWYSSIGSRYQVGFVQQQAVMNCQQASGSYCQSRGCN